jgi:hypothetical protein
MVSGPCCQAGVLGNNIYLLYHMQRVHYAARGVLVLARTSTTLSWTLGARLLAKS